MVNHSTAVVTHISDTALWIAGLRAQETKRSNPLFRDPLAERLLGAQGGRITDALSKPLNHDWAFAIRTRLIDDWVLRSVAEGADRVINLACGLDTRPYRLDLPEKLVWIEADLPDLVDEKNRMLADDPARCEVRRVKVDLADRVARSAFLKDALRGAQRALVLTEGLLIYLDAHQVRELGQDLRAEPAVAWWMIDLVAPATRRMMQRRLGHQLGKNNEFKFGPVEGVAFFRPLGWKVKDLGSYLKEGQRFRRLPLWMRVVAKFPDANPERPGLRPWAAIVRFERA